ncbi:transcription termination factor Rho [Staphylococcus chromogenes]|nr:transcription termination factor Rho [Staphylococcus chromogenes]
MTEQDNASNPGAGTVNLQALRMPELRKMAEERGIRGISALRKSELIAAIQSGVPAASAASKPRRSTRKAAAPVEAPSAPEQPATESAGTPAAEITIEETAAPRRRRATAKRDEVSGETAPASEATSSEAAESSSDNQENKSERNDGEQRYESRSAARRARRNRARNMQRENNSDHADTQNSGEGAGDSQDNNDRNERRRDRGDRNERGDRDDRGDREERRGRRNRRERGGRNRRDRDRENFDEIQEDDVLQPVGGILDIVDSNAAFVRTTGYQAGPSDVFVPQQMIRKFGLRRGDAIIGQVKMRAEGQHNNHGGRNRQKFNPLVRVESVNGMPVEEAKNRPDFAKLTPLYPNQRLRLETDPKILTTRVIDLIMPIGKGQRALIVSPPKAGKTTILQNIANAISTNNPECYLMVVLVDERPEEVTDMQRSVKGEVIASTFDRPPGEHTAVAELAIERAKRLVEQGQDVVVLLDSITRLGRAYNNSSPASGRILSGGVDSNALYPPKRFLGAARNIENGGSLTIIATAMVETGSAGDTVIFEEFKGTGNAELKLDRKISERRVFPAVDVNPSGTRKDELLLVPEEARIMHKLRRILSALDNQQAIDLLIKQLKKTKSNGEFLMQVASSAPMAADLDNEGDYS